MRNFLRAHSYISAIILAAGMSSVGSDLNSADDTMIELQRTHRVNRANTPDSLDDNNDELSDLEADSTTSDQEARK